MTEELFIKIGNEYKQLELNSPSGITLQFKNTITGGLDSIEASRSYTFALPNTSANKKALDSVDIVRKYGNIGMKRYECIYKVDGIQIVYNSFLYVTEIQGTIKANMTFNVIEGLKKLKEENYSINKLTSKDIENNPFALVQQVGNKKQFNQDAVVFLKDTEKDCIFDNSKKALSVTYNAGGGVWNIPTDNQGGLYELGNNPSVEGEDDTEKYLLKVTDNIDRDKEPAEMIAELKTNSNVNENDISEAILMRADSCPYVVPVRKIMSAIEIVSGIKFDFLHDIDSISREINAQTKTADLFNYGVVPMVTTKKSEELCEATTYRFDLIGFKKENFDAITGAVYDKGELLNKDDDCDLLFMRWSVENPPSFVPDDNNESLEIKAGEELLNMSPFSNYNLYGNKGQRLIPETPTDYTNYTTLYPENGSNFSSFSIPGGCNLHVEGSIALHFFSSISAKNLMILAPYFVRGTGGINPLNGTRFGLMSRVHSYTLSEGAYSPNTDAVYMSNLKDIRSGDLDIKEYNYYGYTAENYYNFPRIPLVFATHNKPDVVSGHAEIYALKNIFAEQKYQQRFYLYIDWEEGYMNHWVDIYSCLPDITCLDFIKNIYLLSATFPIVRKNGVIGRASYSDIVDNVNNHYDWSANIIESEEKHRIGHNSFKSKNFILMANENLDGKKVADQEEKEDNYSSPKLEFDNLNNIEDEVSSVQLKFYGSWQSRKEFTEITGVGVHYWDIKKAESDDGIKFAGLKVDGGWQNVRFFAPYSYEATEMKPSIMLVHQHYMASQYNHGNAYALQAYPLTSATLETLRSFQIYKEIFKDIVEIEITLRIPLIELSELDYTRPVYLEKYNSYFLIDEIEFSVSSGLCKAKLIKLNMKNLLAI